MPEGIGYGDDPEMRLFAPDVASMSDDEVFRLMLADDTPAHQEPAAAPSLAPDPAMTGEILAMQEQAARMSAAGPSRALTHPEEITMLARSDAHVADLFPEPAPSPVDQTFADAVSSEEEAFRLRQLANQRTRVSAPNPLYPATARYTGEELSEGGLLDRETQDIDALAAAALGQEREKIEVMDEVAARQRDMSTDRQAAELDRKRRIDEAFENQKRAMGTYETATQRVRESQELDPNKWWKDKTTGNKIVTAIAVMLAAAGGGLAGHTTAGVDLIRKLAQPEVDRQKEAYTRLQHGVTDAKERVGLESSVYAQMMGAVQDERVAEASVEAQVMETALAEFDARVAAAGIPVLTAELQAQRTALEQAVNEKRFHLERLSALTPARITRSAHALPKEARAELLHQAGRAEKRADQFADVEFGIRKSEMIDIPKEERKAAAASQGDIKGRQLVTVQEQIAKHSTRMRTAKALLGRTDDLPGTGRIAGGIQRLWGSAAAGQVLGDLEDLGIDPSLSTDEVRGRLQSLIAREQDEIKDRLRALPPELRRQMVGSEVAIDPLSLGGAQAAPSQVRED